VELDPSAPILRANLAGTFWLAGRYNEAVQQGQATVEMDQNFPLGHNVLGRAYLGKGDHSKAIGELNRALDLEKDDAGYLAQLAVGYAVSGMKDKAHKRLAELLAKKKRPHVASTDLARVYAALGEKAQALDWLEKAYEESDDGLPLLKVLPELSCLHGEPRYQALVKKLNFPP
jgi:serine/threonine-protein kinase